MSWKEMIFQEARVDASSSAGAKVYPETDGEKRKLNELLGGQRNIAGVGSVVVAPGGSYFQTRSVGGNEIAKGVKNYLEGGDFSEITKANERANRIKIR